MDDSFVYRYRPRVTGEQSAYSWYPHAPRRNERPREPEYEHQAAIADNVSTQHVDYVVSPEWVSDEMKRDTIQPFRGRRWWPWPWEFHGARNWPYVNVENRLEEERQLKALLTSREAPQEARPVQCYERQELGPPIRLRLIEQKAPWRPQSSTWRGYVANSEGAVYGDPSRPLHRPQSVQFSRHLSKFEDYKYTPGFEEYYDHESPYHFHHPDDVGVTGGSHIKTKRHAAHSEADKRKAIQLYPDLPSNQRPRFDKPYLNTANAMWIGAKFAASPAQN